MRKPDGFNLYTAPDNGIMFPKEGEGIILLAEQMNNAFPVLGTIPLGNQVKTVFAPVTLNNIRLTEEDVKASLGSKKYNVTQNVKAIMQSFILDSTPYIANLYNKLNPTSYTSYAMKFYSSMIALLDQEISVDINEWSLVYIFDTALLQHKITPSELYFWFFLKYAMDNDGNADTAFPFNKVFFMLKKSGTTTVTKIYERGQTIDFDSIKKLFLNVKNDFLTQGQPVEKKVSTTPEDKKSYLEKILSLIPPLKVPEEPKEEVEQGDNATTPENVVNAIKADTTVNITKNSINPDNINNFSFLLSKRTPTPQAKAISNDQINTIAKFVALKDGDGKSRESILATFQKIKNNLTSHSKLASDAIGLLKDKKLDALSVYVNQATEQYSSKIYPVKPEVQKEALDQLDKWSNQRGYDKPQSIDPVLTASVVDSYVHSNFHRAMAQKEITWQEMPQQIEEMVTPVLADAGFKFLSIMMVDNPPDPRQVEPTYMTDIKIRIQNTKTKKIQTVSFMVPTLIDGKYSISGGIKWLFPNVIATLPIFVIESGKVQFKTNYSAMTFQHVITSKKDTVTLLVGGVNMSLLVWFLQLKSWNDICQDYGMTYQIVNAKKEIPENSPLTIKLPDKKYMVITINSSDDAQKKVARALIYDLQPLINKVGLLIGFDQPDEDAKIITALTGRRTAGYTFKKIKQYMIDIRIGSILKQRNILPDLYNVSKLCAKFSITNTEEDKLGINNVYLRLMDLIPCEIERAFHYALTEYRRRSTIDPDIPLMVNSGWVINALREQAVLLLYKDGNPTIETAQFTAVRLVGPGAFSKTDTVQVKDRRIPPSHFGVIDPIDTAEGAPGIQTYLSSGFEYDPDHKVFSQPERNNNYTNMFSSSASMIPFINHDDGNRAQFGCSQTRQVVPVINSEPPLVGTGMEAYLPSYASTKFIKKAKRNGTVIYVDDKCIILQYDDGSYDKLDIRSEPLQTGSGKANAVVQTPLVKPGDKVKAFQQLVKNPFINGSYSSGVNVLAAFKTEEGYSYEDGVVVSESFAKKCTSTHYSTIDLSVDSPAELKVFPIQKFKETGSMKYEAGEVIVKTSIGALGGFQEASVIAPTHCEVVDIQIWPAKPDFIPLVKEIDKTLNGKANTALRQSGLQPLTNVNQIIDNVGKFKYRKDELTRTFIRIKVIEYRICGLGDKLNNRHGNKGVITQIVPDDLMPVLPDGRHIDICLNPLGCVSRMNLGQLFEIHVGNVLDKAHRNLQAMNNDNEARDMLCQLYTLLDGGKEKKLSSQIVANLKAMGAGQLHQTIQYLKDHGIRMIFPAYDNLTIDQINEAAKFVGTELTSRLYEPRYKRYTINKCAVGILFINKLEHIASIKENIRSVGRYMTTNMMPAKAGQHRNAIRVSEMDTWCILASGANTVLKELFTVNGNNQRAKLKVIGDIENSGTASVGDITDFGDTGSNDQFKVYATTAGLSI